MVQVLSEHCQYQRLLYTLYALTSDTDERIPSRVRGRLPGFTEPQASVADSHRSYGLWQSSLMSGKAKWDDASYAQGMDRSYER
jgi:hypothetical protein